MKRVFCSFLIITFLFGTAGCSKTNNASQNSENTVSNTTINTPKSNTSGSSQNTAKPENNTVNNNEKDDEQYKQDKILAEEFSRKIIVLFVEKWSQDKMSNNEIAKYLGPELSIEKTKLLYPANDPKFKGKNAKLENFTEITSYISTSPSEQYDSNTFEVVNIVGFDIKLPDGKTESYFTAPVLVIKKVNGEMKCSDILEDYAGYHAKGEGL